MSKQATMQIRVDETVKAEAEALFEALGLSLSEAVRLFVAESVNERRCPSPRTSARAKAPPPPSGSCVITAIPAKRATSGPPGCTSRRQTRPAAPEPRATSPGR